MLILVCYDHFGASSGRAAIFSVFSQNLGCPEVYFWMLQDVWGHVGPRGGVFSLPEDENTPLERQGDPKTPQDTPKTPPNRNLNNVKITKY